MGALVEDTATGDGSIVGLSCYHVVGDAFDPFPDHIWQPKAPPLPVGVNPPTDNYVGEVLRVDYPNTTPLPGSPILTGLTDSAVFSTNGAIDEGRAVTQAIANQGLGQPDLVQAVTDTADPYVQQRVKKRGYLTGPTTGLVIGVLMSFPWGPAGTNRYLIEQVEIAGDEPNSPFFAQPGDSGSLVVDVETPTTAVGLLWGANPGGDWGTVGSGKVGVMSPIRAVEAQLGISVVWA
jgi:hypothetical protein